MRAIHLFLVLTLCSFAFGEDEFVTIEKTGMGKQHVAETRFYFAGDDCYAAKRSYSNLLDHVIVPRVFWDLYFEGDLVATFGPAERDLSYVRVPSGHEFRKQLSRFTISKDEEVLRIWNLRDGAVTIYSDKELKRLSEKKTAKLKDPQFAKMMSSFRPRLKAPTKVEAEKKMTKSVESNE